MNNCIKCGAELSSDEIGLHKKLFGKTAERFMCIHCAADYLGVSEDMLKKKIEQFKKAGCTLFSTDMTA